MLFPAIFRAAYLGLMFAANLLLANLLAPAGLGQLSLLVLNASLVSLLSGLGSDGMALHALSTHKWTISYGVSFLIKMSAVQLGIFTLLQGGSWLLTGKSLLTQSKTDLLAIELLFFLGLVLTEKLMVLYYVQQRSRLYNVLLFSGAGIYLVVLGVLWAKEIRLPPETLFWIVGFQSMIQGLTLALVYLIKYCKISIERINWIETKTILRTSAIVMFTNVVQLFAYRIDYWLLKHFHSAYEVGLYAQANKIASLLWLLPNIIAALLIPIFSRLEKWEIQGVFRLANLLNLIMLLATAVATWVIYKYFLLPQYSKGLQAFWLMLPGYFLWSMVIYFAAYFSWQGMFTVNLIASGFCFITIALTDFILIPSYAESGAAIGNSIAYITTFLVYLYLLKKKVGFNLFSILSFKVADKYVLKKLIQ